MGKELKEIARGLKRTLVLMQKPEKAMLALASLIMLVTGTLTNLPAIILGRLVDRLVDAPNIEYTLAVPAIASIVVIILIREGLTVLRKYLVENIATQTEKKQTVNAISHLLHTDIASITNQQIGSLHGRIFRSIQGLVKLIKLSFLDFLPTFFGALAAIVIALLQKPLLASIMILVIPAGFFIIIKQISSQKGIRVALLRGKEKIDGTVVEMLGGVETVRALNTEALEINKVEKVAEELRQKEIRHHISMALFDAGKYLNEGFFYILVISLAIYFAANGIISEGDILVYSILFASITGPLREIHRILDEAHESSIKVNDLNGLLNQPKDISYEEHTKIGGRVGDEDAIVLDNVSFFYPDRREVKILHDLNNSIRRGEKIGIAGASGCGKSTLVKILLRLVHDYTGQIIYFGKDLRQLSREEIAASIAYLPQKTYIFAGSIRQNILYGSKKSKISDEQIFEAIRLANLDKEIGESLGGLSGHVTENGNNLSGGQRQRLAIARLILQSPDVLIFDEATSALDNINESIIQRNIEELFSDKTIITIAHRLTTLKNSDRILVFDRGRIVQEGSYDELSGVDGRFHDFLVQSPDFNRTAKL